MYLYRAVDSQENTLDFHLSPTRDVQAAKRFFSTVLGASHTITPRVISADKNVAYPKAVRNLKQEKIILEGCQLRQSNSLNNLVEQDHRAHQTAHETRNGLLFFRDSLADIAGV